MAKTNNSVSNLKKGDQSGCLEIVSNDFEANNNEIVKKINLAAENVWNSRESSNRINLNFEEYYGLNKKEEELFKLKKEMPNSFVKKFYATLWSMQKIKLWNGLYHKKKPDTLSDLLFGYKKKELYKCKCSICKREYFIDEDSFSCVKWQSCCGADCLSTTVNNIQQDYVNLATEENNNSSLIKVNTDMLQMVEEISNPLSYYGGHSCYSLEISYISDVHLMHHILRDVCNNNPSLLSNYSNYIENNKTVPTAINNYLNKVIKQLYLNSDLGRVIVFLGDTCSIPEICVQFYKNFIKYNDYLAYKESKKEFLELKEYAKLKFLYTKKKQGEIDEIEKSIKTLIEGRITEKNLNDICKYKEKSWSHLLWAENIKHYKKTKKYKMQKQSKEYDRLLDDFARKKDLLDDKIEELSELGLPYKDEKIDEIETNTSESILKLSFSNVYTKQESLTDLKLICVILGNHEYIGFKNVNEAVSFYKTNLGPLGIKVLQNDTISFKHREKEYLIYGGTGFAKYNQTYNANNVCCCKNFTREQEIKETEKFENGYFEAKKKATENGSCFICFSHYPTYDCLGKCEKDAIYFYGHNHSNFYCRNTEKTVYADNQIGYKQPIACFKSMTTGAELNPYFDLSDGLYKTTIKDYLQFYRYIGENIGYGSTLYKRCENDKASIYLVKKYGYYGFFLLNKTKTSSKGISVVNGGLTKKITNSIDIQWIYNNFEVLLNQYIKILLPYRQFEKKLSGELKSLGFDGEIHGSIIDVNFYNHIMINPFDGKATIYYSPSFGRIKSFSSFKEMLSARENKIDFANKNIKLIIDKMEKNNYFLGKINDSNDLIEYNSFSLMNNNDFQIVETSGGMYGVSRRIKTLQRIFTGHVLREFDLSLIDD